MTKAYLVKAILGGTNSISFVNGPNTKSVGITGRARGPSRHARRVVTSFGTTGLGPALAAGFLKALVAGIIFGSIIGAVYALFRVRVNRFVSCPKTRQLDGRLVGRTCSIARQTNVGLLGSHRAR